MSSLPDLQINLNGQFTFFLNQGLISEHSKSLRKLIKQSKKKKKLRSKEVMIIEIDDFPGGSDGFELVSRFCYSNGEILINLSNVSILYCCSVFLDMTNLLIKTEKYLQGLFYWSLNDIVSCLKNSEQVFIYADYYGFIDKLIFVALTKISEKSDEYSYSPPSSSASATLSPSPETTKNTPEFNKKYSFQSVSCGTRNEYWFEDMSNLSPQMILKLLNIHGGYKTTIKSLVLTRFLLHYLNKRLQTKSEITKNKLEYSVLADKAVQGVIFESKTAFSCRKLFWILRVLSNFNLSKESKKGLETLIGEILDQATLDDLLISASDENRKNGVFNVDLVIRLLKVFVKKSKEKKKMKEIGELTDKYLREISPDQNLKVSKFLKVAESLPDSARDLFDGVYRAIDIYLQSHPNVSVEEQGKLCRCLNYKKLTLETCKHLARNPKIPPDIAIEALKYQKPATMSENVEVVSKRSMVSGRYSIEEPVLLHLRDFEISEKLVAAAESKIKGRGRYRNWRVMDSFREGSKSR